MDHSATSSPSAKPDTPEERPARGASAASGAESGAAPASGPAFEPASGASRIDTSVPHSARIWNYWLGGKDNYAVDREAGDAYRQTFPGIVDIARASRYFLVRSIKYLAAEAGIRQFLDVGTGLPTVDNTHEVAQRSAPESRIVYVDNDPLVLLHAQALLTSSPEGSTTYLEADLHEPENILEQAGRTLDFKQPVALILSDVMGHVADDEEAVDIVRRLVAGLSPGSYLVLSHGVEHDPAIIEAQRRYNDSGAVPYVLRTPAQIERFFAGLALVEPGVVAMPEWRAETAPLGELPPGVGFGGVARVP
ncbi:SAM-dependent methyltransferase [Streptomyces hoynatensis]|uniref:SAM-dependent methyltransferase n=1 Tax=Streptomyces hoynatensis TaxID=1141874 RepID=A0A3A9YWV6_9ACTN|nr:SAM-dependent methyltransferase [Streptomyces hoynatensis]RKN39727.1 SAM-dependent methyltransferase [Streptomyces hoynatensis]